MRYRKLGRTGLEVSEIGLGAWGIGADAWKGGTDADSLAAMRRAVELGVNFIDTAIVYGSGHSEKLVGQIKREHPELIIATKVNPADWVWPAKDTTAADDAFSAAHVIARTEESLRNLGIDVIDVQQFHVWSDNWVDQGTWLEGIEKLKADGKIRFFGVSVNDSQPNSVLKLVESGLVDSVQVIYNIYDQAPEDKLFPLCEQHDVGVIVRVPFDEGSLTGKVTPETVFEEGDFRNTYFAGERKQQVWDSVQKIAADLEIPLERLPEMALRFCLAHPAVSTVIPGMRSVPHVEMNVAAGNAGPLSPEQVEKLRPHRWVHDWYH
ncbi:MAG: aldo/keto reductase [Gaiellaceae bacterium]|jgi:aryl-alcohol dehydrogenase-like predicted oxidoreductase